MKIHVLSDLHVEFGNFGIPDVDADLVILAGDIHISDKGMAWLIEQDLKTPVIYVLGNHEFYYDTFPDLIDTLKSEAKGTNVHLLENDAVEIGGVRLFGCTLWSDMALSGDRRAAMAAAADGMNDYYLIQSGGSHRRLTPKETVAWHQTSAGKLREFLNCGDPRKSVVVTHSVPSIQSIPERFREHVLAPAFASNLESLMWDYAPALWIHGHTHDSFDYRIGETRIICNPRGYVPNADNPHFDEAMVVEL